jgi:hypothetical protein
MVIEGMRIVPYSILDGFYFNVKCAGYFSSEKLNRTYAVIIYIKNINKYVDCIENNVIIPAEILIYDYTSRQQVLLRPLYMHSFWRNRMMDNSQEMQSFQLAIEFNKLKFDKRRKEFKYKNEFIDIIDNFINNEERRKQVARLFFLNRGL